MSRANCNAMQLAVCYLVDKKMGISEAAHLLNISPALASKTYSKYADQIAAARREIQGEKAQITEGKKPCPAQDAAIIKLFNAYTDCCLSHFNILRERWTLLTFNQYAAARSLIFFKTFSMKSLSFSIGVSTSGTRIIFNELISVGIVTSLESKAAPVLTTAAFHAKYTQKIHAVTLDASIANLDFRQ